MPAGNPAWKKGFCPNPAGKPKGCKTFSKIFEEALERAAKKHKIHLIDHAIEQAYIDNQILGIILKKILPDKTEHSGVDGSPISVEMILFGEKKEKWQKGNAEDKPAA